MKRFSHNQIFKIYRKYLAGSSVAELAREYQVYPLTFYLRFRKLGLKLCRKRQNRFVDHSWFDAIDTPAKAYFVGLFMADGYYNHQSRLIIKLARSDAQDLKRLSDAIHSDKRAIRFSGNTAILAVGSQQLVAALQKLIGHKKADRLVVPALPKQLMRHFIRGFFDGDGSVSVRKARPHQLRVGLCSIDKSFLLQLNVLLLNEGITARLYKENRAGKSIRVPGGKFAKCCFDMYTLQINTHEDRIKFFEYLYSPFHTLCLRRKYNKYRQYYVNAVQRLAVKKPRIPEEDIAPLYRRYSSGESMRALARELGVCNTTLRHRFIRAGFNTELRNA